MNESELTLLILRIGFLLLLWFFIFAIVYALRSDLFGAPVRRLKGDSSGAQVLATPVVGQAASPSVPPIAPDFSAADAAAPTQAVSHAQPAAPEAHAAAPEAARHLVITSGVATGTSIPLDDDFVSIGRSGDSTLVIVDEYTSTYHARLSRQGAQWVLTDLGSTNGTKLAGVRITDPALVPPFTPVTIGTTTFELRP